ncbi:MAG: hypothetical protein R3B45_05280 [Bdellovibrionota bacterium]
MTTFTIASIKPNHFKCILIINLVSLLLLSCGTNFFESVDKSDAAADATIQLEKGNASKAEDILLNALGSDYTKLYESASSTSDLDSLKDDLTTEMRQLIDSGDLKEAPNLISILASARAQRHGIDPFEIALKFADSSTSSSQSSDSADSTTSSSPNELTMLFPVLPEASGDNITGLDIALMLLGSLAEEKQVADQYKEALFLTASIALITKSLDTDGDGTITALESITLSDAAAQVLLNQIASAASAAADSGDLTSDGESSLSAQQIQALQSQIDAQDGGTQEEKLRNFIAQNKS